MLPIQITIRDMPVSSAIETYIRKRAEKLNRFYNRISSCRIVIELPQKHKRQGKLYNVRIDLTVPGKELVVTHKTNQDIYIALRDAFKAIERQLEEHSHKRHGRVKMHNGVLHGRIVSLNQAEGFGLIERVDDHTRYYFAMTNVAHPDFLKLHVGDRVEFHGEIINDGQQAQHVIKARNQVMRKEEVMHI